jgi:7,8-dihydroneopterin aldolase/epimerase/oxygenase
MAFGGIPALMTDRIFIDNIRLSCRVGIGEPERRNAQDVLVDVSLFLDLSQAAESDDVKRTVNYKDALQCVSSFVTGKEFGLLESVAEGVAATVLDAFPAERVVVRVRKAKYSSEPSIGIEVTRDRKIWSSR